MDIDSAIRAEKASGDEHCVFCDKSLPEGTPIVSGQHRIGGKVIGKTVRVESCIDCSKALRDLIDLRVGEAAKL